MYQKSQLLRKPASVPNALLAAIRASFRQSSCSHIILSIILPTLVWCLPPFTNCTRGVSGQGGFRFSQFLRSSRRGPSGGRLRAAAAGAPAATNAKIKKRGGQVSERRASGRPGVRTSRRSCRRPCVYSGPLQFDQRKIDKLLDRQTTARLHYYCVYHIFCR